MSRSLCRRVALESTQLSIGKRRETKETIQSSDFRLFL